MLQVGDRVRFSTNFCQRVQADKEIADLEGTVKYVFPRPIPRVKVAWDDGGESGSLEVNLTKIKGRD